VGRVVSDQLGELGLDLLLAGLGIGLDGVTAADQAW